MHEALKGKFLIYQKYSWPFLRKLAESAVQWTESVSMAQHFDTREEAEVEACRVAVRLGFSCTLLVVPYEEALHLEEEFASVNSPIRRRRRAPM